MIPRRWAHIEPGERADMRRWMQENAQQGTAFIEQWETRFAQIIGSPHAAAINSGRQGLRMALDFFGVGPGDEIIVPAYTFGEILAPMQATGAHLVPADIDPHTFTISRESVACRITPRTKLILTVHLFGMPCDIEAIVRLAADHKIPVIEDCAHALGARLHGQALGVFGDAAFFSLETTKMINTYGGGMIVSAFPELIGQARAFNAAEPAGSLGVSRKMRAAWVEQWLFRTRLIFPALYLLAAPRWQPLVNRMYRGAQHGRSIREAYGVAQARLGLRKIEDLEERLEQRRHRAALMRTLLKSDIEPQRIPEGAEPTYYFFVVLLPRDAVEVRRRLLLKGIDAAVGNEVMDDCAALLGHDDCVNAKEVSNRAMALPMFDGISEHACERVARTLNALV